METIFMEQPPGFIHSKLPHHVCHLKKSLYGLKQAPRAWFDKLSSFLIELGFMCSHADSSLFVRRDSRGTVVLLVYVDDIIISGDSKALLNDVIQRLSMTCALKDLGTLHYFLGVEATFFSGGLFLSQYKYARELLSKADMINAKKKNTPLAQKHGLDSLQSPPIDPTGYRKLVGALQYLTITRPHITHAVNLACQFMHAPLLVHLQGVKRILRYVCGTVDHGLRLIACSSLNITAYTDADWGGCALTRRSTTGFCIFLGANCISWTSRKQPTVARSSAEAEYRPLASCAAEVTWLTYIC